MTCSSSTALDKASLIADILVLAVSKISRIRVAAVPLSHLAVGANIGAAAEEINHPRDVVPMNFFGAQINVNADYVGFVASIGAAAEITAIASGVTLGATFGAGLTILGFASLILAGASNDKLRDIATDPAFWRSIGELLENGNTQPIRRYIKQYECTDEVATLKNKFHKSKQIVSPLVLDLNNDGITTTGLTDGAYFDHDANGFAEATGQKGSASRLFRVTAEIKYPFELPAIPVP